MTKLVWNRTDQKKYENGIDRGVLYPSDTSGVVWNGLINVEESYSGGESNSYHFDGVKYLDVVSPRNFQATLTAFSAPYEFERFLGNKVVIPGFVLTRQPRERFGLSYRTRIADVGYKIHIVYNALASPGNVGYSSTGDTPSPMSLSWKIDAVPPVRENYRPSAHYVIDSTLMDPDALETIEYILYGSAEKEPKLPNLDELVDMIALWAPLVIVPQNVTGLAQLIVGSGDLYKTKVAGIYRDLPKTRLTISPINGLYRME